MPQVLGLVLIGAGVIAGIKALQKIADRVSEEMHRHADAVRRHEEARQAAEGTSAKDLGRLELDPQSGIYKPRSS